MGDYVKKGNYDDVEVFYLQAGIDNDTGEYVGFIRFRHNGRIKRIEICRSKCEETNTCSVKLDENKSTKVYK